MDLVAVFWLTVYTVSKCMIRTALLQSSQVTTERDVRFGITVVYSPRSGPEEMKSRPMRPMPAREAGRIW